MKKIIFLFIIFFLSILKINALEIKSENAILYNLNDNSVLYEKNSKDKVQIASLTKIVTAITVIENIEDLNKEVIITYEMIKGLSGYAKLGLKVGDKLSYLDLLYALMLPSAADAAKALAISTSGSIDEFSILMNKQVEKIGVTNSKFDNPIGMDSENNYSTAYDLSQILIYSLKNNTFKELFNSNFYKIKNLNKIVEKTVTTTGKKYNIDTSIIKGAKTGFTYDAGLCMASISTLEDVNYLLITLGSPIEYPYNIIDTIDIYKYYSSNFGYINILSKKQLLNTIKVKNSKTKTYDIYSKDNISLYLSKTINKENLIYEYEGIEKLKKKIKIGDKLGKVKVISDGDIIYTYDVYLDVEIKYYNYLLYIIVSLSIIILISILSYVIKRVKNK